MESTATTSLVRRHLYGDEGHFLYAVLDGASVENLLTALYTQQPHYECLYRGELEPDIAEVAPYLVCLEPDASFTRWVVDEGWGNHWGVFAQSAATLDELRRHFRKFLVVHDAEGNPLLFRYYDPRVLRTYLPTCTPEEIDAVFGPVSAYVAEDKDPAFALRFRNDGGRLQQERLRLAPESVGTSRR